MAILQMWLNRVKQDLLSAENKQRKYPSDKNCDFMWQNAVTLTFVKKELEKCGFEKPIYTGM